MVSIAKTSRSCTFSLFKLQLPWKCLLIFLSEIFYFYFLWVPWLEVKFILLFKYIYHAWGKISSERDIFILAWGMLQVICILKEINKICFVVRDNTRFYTSLITLLYFIAFFVFTWVIARCLWHKNCWCKYKRVDAVLFKELTHCL